MKINKTNKSMDQYQWRLQNLQQAMNIIIRLALWLKSWKGGDSLASQGAKKVLAFPKDFIFIFFLWAGISKRIRTRKNKYVKHTKIYLKANTQWIYGCFYQAFLSFISAYENLELEDSHEVNIFQYKAQCSIEETILSNN